MLTGDRDSLLFRQERLYDQEVQIMRILVSLLAGAGALLLLSCLTVPGSPSQEFYPSDDDILQLLLDARGIFEDQGSGLMSSVTEDGSLRLSAEVENYTAQDSLRSYSGTVSVISTVDTSGGFSSSEFRLSLLCEQPSFSCSLRVLYEPSLLEYSLPVCRVNGREYDRQRMLVLLRMLDTELSSVQQGRSAW